MTAVLHCTILRYQDHGRRAMDVWQLRRKASYMYTYAPHANPRGSLSGPTEGILHRGESEEASANARERNAVLKGCEDADQTDVL